LKKYKGLDCILLIDDDEANHFLTQLSIKKAKIDAHVQVVYDGVEALEYLTTTGKYASEPTFPQPGIIFLDINMPRMNGWEFLHKYEQLPVEQKGNIVIVMLTSSSNSDDIKKAEDLNELVDYLIKPLTLKKLEKIITDNFDE